MDGDSFIEEADVLEEIELDDADDEQVLAAGVEDATVDDYDGDEEDTEEEITDEKCLLVFKEHKDSVFVVDVDSRNLHAVSGGEDEMAYVWKIETGETMFKCEGHKDSVTCASFNAAGTMVATGDMSGFIQVWSIESKSQIWNFETGDLEWMQWHPVAPVLLAGTHDGQCWMWQIPKGNCKTFASHGVVACCGSFLPDGKSAAVGYEDGSLKLFDLKTTEALHTVKGRDAHNAGVSEVTVHSSEQLIATSSLDGTSKLISTTTGKVSASYNCCLNQQSKGDTEDSEANESVECVAFSPSLTLLATGCLDGSLHVWDYKTGNLRHTCKHEDGVTKLIWDPGQCGGALVYTGCLDGRCRSWDARNGELVSTFSGHADHIYDLKITLNGEKLITASADGSVRVFLVRDKDSQPIR